MLLFLTNYFGCSIRAPLFSFISPDIFYKLPDNLRIPLYFIAVPYKIESGIVTSHRHSITIVNIYINLYTICSILRCILRFADYRRQQNHPAGPDPVLQKEG